MKKRFLCAILSLILLVSLVPAGALTASAATNKVSEKAITVLKQLQGYQANCSTKGYWGYGTKCTEKVTTTSKHGTHKISEKAADKALREELEKIDKSVNSFASANGLSLSQNKHDALVLFSYRNGTAWISGTGDVKRAVTTKATGNDFLNMFCNWQTNEADNNRRLIEANMYLNGAYSTTKPSRFIKVTFDANGGKMPGNQSTFYFDYTLSETKLPIPTKDGYIFKGWYNGTKDDVPTNWVHKLNSACDNVTLTAHWQDAFDKDDKDKKFDSSKVTKVNYQMPSSMLATQYVYTQPGGTCINSVSGVGARASVSGILNVIGEYVDGNGVKWVQLGKVEKYTCIDASGTAVYPDKDKGRDTMDLSSVGYWGKVGVPITDSSDWSSDDSSSVKVTITNSYVNARKEASIYAAKCGSYSQGQTVTIVGDPVEKNGFLWGHVAKDGCWIALMYTNYSSVINSQGSTSSGSTDVIAKAQIKLKDNGYVNVRNGAGTDNMIIGALTTNTMVDIYEIKYVNGQQWGRCNKGWFLLAYADVELTRLVDEGKGETGQIGFTSYTFTGKLVHADRVYTAVGGATLATFEEGKAPKNNQTVTVTNVTWDKNTDTTWGKTSYGWISLSDDTFSMVDSPAKFEVTADSASVRSTPNTASDRIDTLSKGTEFDVKQISATEDTIWGRATKVGDTDHDDYIGWVNLSSRYVKRTNGEAGSSSSGSGSSGTGLVATVIGADEVNVRNKADIYGTFVCKVRQGETYKVLEGPTNGWYRLKISGKEDLQTWVYSQYLDVKTGTTSSGSGSGSTSGKVETGKGIVANTYTGVNMRQTPGTAGAFICKVVTGTAVEIQEVKQVGSSKWGKLTINGKTGWVCMDYITMISYEDIPGYNGGTGSTGGSGSTGSTGGSSGNNTVTGAETAIYTGKVMEASSAYSDVDEFSEKGDVTRAGRNKETGQLIVFKTTDINGPVVRQLNPGDPVTMHEILTVQEEFVRPKEDSEGELDGDNYGDGEAVITKTRYWARINDGYVRAPAENLLLDTLDEATYTVVDQDKVYVYEDWSLSTKKTATIKTEDFKGEGSLYLKKGEKVTATEVVLVGNVIAGKIENDDGEVGWVNLSKLTKGSINVQVETTPTTPPATTAPQPTIGDSGNTGNSGIIENINGYRYTGKVINTNELNVRSTASTGASKTASLKSGASLVIYETTISEGMAWGRCDAGWVYLYYVDLTPAGGSAIDARVVYNDNTIIYSDSACTETVGTYTRMAVIDIYEIVGKMARTDKGWVNTDNLL